MAIKVSGEYKNSLFEPVFKVSEGSLNKTQHTTMAAQEVYSIVTNITVECEGLDAEVELTFKQGNNSDYEAIGALVDADNNPIVITADNGGATFTVKLTGFYFGVGLDIGRATTGEVKIYARL